MYLFFLFLSIFIFSKTNRIIYILYLAGFLTNELDLGDGCFPPNNLGKQRSHSSINFAVQAKEKRYK